MPETTLVLRNRSFLTTYYIEFTVLTSGGIRYRKICRRNNAVLLTEYLTDNGFIILRTYLINNGFYVSFLQLGSFYDTEPESDDDNE